VARWLALGWLYVTIARTHSIVLQAVGRPELLAKAHMIELLPYLAALWWLTGEYGIIGTAVAWVVRAMMDAVTLPVLTRYAVPELSKGVGRTLCLLPVLACGFGALVWVESVAAKGLLAAALVGACAGLLIRPLRQLWLTRVPAQSV